MTLRCLLGFHSPSISSITRRAGHLEGLCEQCARPLEKHQQGRWTAAAPLDARLRAE